MRFLLLLSMGLGAARCASISAPDNSTVISLVDEDPTDSQLDDTYDPDDPEIADIDMIDSSEIYMTAYTDEMIAADNALSDNNTLEARSMYKHYCHLHGYDTVTLGTMVSGINYLRGLQGKGFCCPAKTCCRPSCSYGKGINVCNGMERKKCYVLGGLGARFRHLWHDTCKHSKICHPYYYAPLCSEVKQALQGFWHTKRGYFNIIARGGFDC